ncbi:MAG: metallophosphoesterase family protein [Bacteroidales bacterium]
MMTIPGDPATSAAVSWRTLLDDSISIGEIAVVDATPYLEENSISQTGTFSLWETGSTDYMGHKVVFNGLKPETKYVYRVGNGRNWSEWFQFETSSNKPEPFSFLYFGDIQNNIKSLGSRVLRQGFTHYPDADFMLFVGDLVNASKTDLWEQFFYAGGWMFGMKPSLITPGNHEYRKEEDLSRSFSNHWNQIFTLPENGPVTKIPNHGYYVDYQGVRFITFDSPAIMYNEVTRELVLEWLDKTLTENPYRWTVVFTHFPVYGCSIGRDNAEYQNAVKPVLEKHGVDLVLQGHDHTYCRGQNLEHVDASSDNKPMYIVTVAGPKMYGLGTNFWSDRVASNTQLYQRISFSGNTLSYKSFTVAGDLYDEFELIKNKAGVNRLVESNAIKNINQHTDIPERVKGRYTEEDLRKYNQKYQKL